MDNQQPNSAPRFLAAFHYPTTDTMTRLIEAGLAMVEDERDAGEEKEFINTLTAVNFTSSYARDRAGFFADNSTKSADEKFEEDFDFRMLLATYFRAGMLLGMSSR